MSAIGGCTRLRLQHRRSKYRLYTLSPLPMPQAVRSTVYYTRNFLSEEEIDIVLQYIHSFDLPMYTSNPAHDLDPDGNAVHTTTYLNTENKFSRQMPWLKRKIRRLVEKANAYEEWGFDTRSDNFNIRVVEYHKMGRHGSLNDIHHFDKGSLITVDIMLKEADEGAEFYTQSGSMLCVGSEKISENFQLLQKHDFHDGDALVFVSHKPHCVSPLKTGHRRVLVLEYWNGVECHCGHRCEERERGVCTFVDEDI